MKTASLLLAALAALPALAQASSLQTYNSSFNNYDLQADFINNGGYISNVPVATDFSAPVGSGMFRYSGAPVADGTYAFASFSDLTISFSFDVGGTIYSFTQAHIISDTSALDVYLANGAFHFGGSDSTSTYLADFNVIFGGSIVFQNGNNILAMTYDNYDYYGYVIYEASLSAPPTWPVPAMGLYGTTETAYFGASPVPEPSSFAALAGLGALALTVARRRRAA